MEMSNGVANAENCMEIPHKVKNRIAIWSSNPTSGYLTHKNRNQDLEDIFAYLCFAAALLTRQGNNLSVHWWMNKEFMVCIYISEVKWKLLSCVWLFATPWTIQSMEFSSQNTGVGSLLLLQGIFLTLESNWGLLLYRRILNHLSKAPKVLIYTKGYYPLVYINIYKGLLLRLEKEGYCFMCNSMIESWGCDAKWNKPIIEGQILPLYHFYEVYKIIKCTEYNGGFQRKGKWGVETQLV